MNFSKHNIISKIADSESYYIVNPLVGEADIMDQLQYNNLITLQKGETISDKEFTNELIAKKYIIDPEEESKLFKNSYLNFLDERESDEVQIFFVPNYVCNFACTYCYQDEYTNPNKIATPEIIDAFFSYVTVQFASRKKYITVFGGEPLMAGDRQKELITKLIAKSNDTKIDLCIVTNGYTLKSYLPLLQTGRIREIQITLDGTSQIHNQRRFLKGGGDTFNSIAEGISACLDAKIDVNLRMVIDKENIDELPKLAQFAIDNGWTSSPYFKTQIGRNYELHHCQSERDRLFDRLSIYQTIYNLIEKYPHIIEFYKPGYSIAKFLSENGEMPQPLFDSCPACKTEWAFDFSGQIFPCTATVGKESEALGTFYPEVKLHQELVSAWEERDVTSIGKCQSCNVRLACGGGCGSVAKNNNNNNICSPDCRPVEGLLELGFGYYFKE